MQFYDYKHIQSTAGMDWTKAVVGYLIGQQSGRLKIEVEDEEEGTERARHGEKRGDWGEST